MILLILYNSTSFCEASEIGAKVPVALAWRADGQLAVALRDSAEVLIIEPKTWSIVETRKLPFRPSALAAWSHSSTLIVGGMNGEIASINDAGIRILGDPTHRGATQLLASGANQLILAERWDRSLSVYQYRAGKLTKTSRVPLQFSPGRLVGRSEDQFFVLDSFGSRIANVNLLNGQVRTRWLDGVNLHGGALSGDGQELLVGHMSQNREVPITEPNIDSGLVLSATLSAVRVDEFDGEESTEGKKLSSRRLKLDGPAHGAADPSAIAITPDGTQVFLALSGAHQILKNDRTLGSTWTQQTGGLLPLGHNQKLEALEVGRTPLDLKINPGGEFLVSADAMSDSLTVVSTKTFELLNRVDLGKGQFNPTQVQIGEALFSDGRRALDRWFTCASCHPHGHTNGLNFDTLGDQSYGAAKNTISLLGVAQTPPYSWIGQFASLEDQVHQSFQTSLRGKAVDPTMIENLSAYLRTLDFPPALLATRSHSAARGERVFERSQCGACHQPETYSSRGVLRVGLNDGPGGHKAFNPPSLRGVLWSAPYFHDGRAVNLTDVLLVHPDHPLAPMMDSDRDDLIAYLESL